MSSAKALRLFFILIVFFAAPAVMAQQVPPEPTQLALEVRFYPNEPPAYQAVPRTASNGAWYARFHRIKETGPNDLPVNAVNIKSVMAPDGIHVSVSVFFGELHEKEKSIAAYTIHEGEKVKTQELSQFGIDPFIIAAVNFSPAAFALPEFISKATSIEYVGIQPNVSTLPSYRVAVRNLSNKNVSALLVHVLKGGQPQMTILPQGKEGASLIPIGNAYEFDARVATRATPTPTGYAQVTLSGQVIEVSTAIFEDGSFEGDAEPALQYAASLQGDKIQLARVIGLFQTALDESQRDPATTIETLRTSLAALSLEADQALAEDVIAKFGQPVKKTPQDLKNTIQVGLRLVQSQALNETKQFQLRNPTPAPEVVHRWLASAKQRYEAWLSRL